MVVDLKGFVQTGIAGFYFTLDKTDAPLLLHFNGSDDLYALALEDKAAYADNVIGRMVGSAMLPSLFHQDPRYFYKGTGSFPSRTMYAISSAVITRDDSGRTRPNYSHVLGVFAAAALSNLYYPKASRGLTLTLVNGAVETAGNAGSNIAREFILKGITTHAGGKP